MKIAIGNSRKEQIWKNVDWTWEQFADRCAQTHRTTETVEEYKKMPRTQRDEIKDVGGFVGGTLTEGRRTGECVVSRSLLTLDLDQASVSIRDELKMFFGYQWVMYSTHNHTPEAPRVRLVVPLSREVTPEEYQAVARMVAKDIGIEMVDETCYRAQQLMYWASTSIDGEFLYEKNDGPRLDPDVFLARYKDWHDASSWPTSSREAKAVKATVKRQEDPLTKKGLIGGFCRTYSIKDVIAKFLSNVYKPSVVSGRYDYVNSKSGSSAGVVIYDNKFSYSHHASDPAGGKLLNAFDLVRIHKFGELDKGTEPVTAIRDLPSYKAMIELVRNDPKVKIETLKDFTSQNIAKKTGDWREVLEIDKYGNIKPSLTNFVNIVRNDPKLLSICYNELFNSITVRDNKELPWKQHKDGWSDSDMASLSAYLDAEYHIYSNPKLKMALLAVAIERAYHPIKNYFLSLPAWDGVKRVDTLLIDYFGAEESRYTRAVIRKTLLAAVTRIYHPGVKFDTMLILIGDQGIGKSTFFARLGGEWFSDSLLLSDMNSKDAPEKLQGYWIHEIGEMAGMKKAEIEIVKGFVSRVDDNYRCAYGTVPESHPRQCIIVGTTNTKSGVLRDITGNRRFWPVRLINEPIKRPWNMTKDDVAQIWAEVLEIYKADANWYQSGDGLILKGEENEIAVREQREAMETDDREGLVREYLNKLLPEKWGKMSLSARRAYLSGEDLNNPTAVGTIRRERVCHIEIWAECFGKEPSAITKQDSYAIAAIMQGIDDWERYNGNKSGKLCIPPYGSQIAYIRSDKK